MFSEIFFPVYLVGGPCSSHLPWPLPGKLPGWHQLLPALGIRHSPLLLLLLPLTLPCPYCLESSPAFKEVFLCVFLLVATGRTNQACTGSLFGFLFFDSVEYFIYLPALLGSYILFHSSLYWTALTHVFNFFRAPNVNWFFYPLPKQGRFLGHFNSACHCPHLCALL